MNEILPELRVFAEESLPSLIVPIAILVVGWVAALVVAAMTRRALAVAYSVRNGRGSSILRAGEARLPTILSCF